MHETVICPYCKSPAEFVDSAQIYDRSYGMIYLCRSCDAYVGTHKSGFKEGKPLGSMANPALRKLRQETHKIFDALWNKRGSPMSRTQAYQWLARAMHLPSETAHIAMFDEARCRKAIETVKASGGVFTNPDRHAPFRHFGSVDYRRA